MLNQDAEWIKCFGHYRLLRSWIAAMSHDHGWLQRSWVASWELRSDWPARTWTEMLWAHGGSRSKGPDDNSNLSPCLTRSDNVKRLTNSYFNLYTTIAELLLWRLKQRHELTTTLLSHLGLATPNRYSKGWPFASFGTCGKISHSIITRPDLFWCQS